LEDNNSNNNNHVAVSEDYHVDDADGHDGQDEGVGQEPSVVFPAEEIREQENEREESKVSLSFDNL
jgi:hypothetical protein